jgi:hypothetical protein
MSRRVDGKNLGIQSQKRSKLTLQDIKVNSIEQLISQPSEHSSRVSLIAIFRDFVEGTLTSTVLTPMPSTSVSRI